MDTNIKGRSYEISCTGMVIKLGIRFKILSMAVKPANLEGSMVEQYPKYKASFSTVILKKLA